MPPDEFAALLDTEDFRTMPLHDRQKVFDVGEAESREWLKGQKVDDATMQGYEEALPKLRAVHRPTDEVIALSRQGPIATAGAAAWRALGDAGASTVGGAAKILDAGAGIVSDVTGTGKIGVFEGVANFTDDVQDAAADVYATNPDNKISNTVGTGVGQAAAILGTSGAAALGLGTKAAVAAPLVIGGLMGAGEGIDTAREMGITNHAGQLGMGAAFAAVEAVTERLGGIGGKQATEALMNGVRPTVGNVVKTVAGEGGEEVLAGSAQDALTAGAGMAVADPNKPGFTTSGYQLPGLNAATAERRVHDFIGGAAGGAVFSGVNLVTSGKPPVAQAQPPPAAQPPAATPAYQESPESITGQRNMVLAGKKPAMILEGVTAAELAPELAQGLVWVDTAAGVVGHLPDVFTPEEVKALAEDDTQRGKLLGYGVGSPPVKPDRVVTVEDAAGNPVVTATADAATADTVETNLQEMAIPGQEVTVLPADQAGVLESSGRPTENAVNNAPSEPVQQTGSDKTIRDEAGQPPGQELASSAAPGTAEASAAEVKPAEKLKAIREGKPVTMYHGSPRTDLTNVRRNSSWTTSKGLAAKYAGPTGRVYETQAVVPESNPTFLTAQSWGEDPAAYFNRPNEIILGVDIQVASRGASAAEVKQRPKYRMKFDRREDGAVDILEWMAGESIRLERPPRPKRNRAGQVTNSFGEHDGLRALRENFPVHFRALTHAGGYKIDEAAMMAADQGFIPDGHVDTFMAAIEAAIKDRRRLKGEVRAREREIEKEGDKALRQGRRQDAAFKKANTADADSQAITSEDMIPGMELEVDGEPMTVMDVQYDEDGNWQGAMLEDGDRFGRQWIEPGEIVHADPGSVKNSEAQPLTDDPFSLPEGDPFNLEAVSAEQLVTEQAKAKERATIADRQNAPLKGDAGEYGTADMFDTTAGDMALFNQRPGSVANISQAQLPRFKTPIGPIRAPGQLVTLKEVRDYLLQATLLPRAGVRRFAERALGIYKIKAEAIRLRAINDLPTLAHEIGHGIHFRQLSPDAAGPAESWGGRFDAELLPLGQVTSQASYSKTQVRMEGVAEFTRLWLTDPALANATAPTFAAHWYSEMEKKAPEMIQRLNVAQRMIARYIAQPEWVKAKAQIVFNPADARPVRTWGEKLRASYASWVNTLQPALDVLNKVAAMEPALQKSAQRVATWMENHRGGWQSKAHGDLFIMQTDLRGKVVGDSMQTLLAELHPSDHQDFSTYLALKRAQELNQRGIRSGFEVAHIDPAEMAAFEKRFEATRQKLLKFQDNTVQMMVDSGLLSNESARQMRDANRDYVPFYRMYEKLTGTSTGVESSRNAGGYVDTSTGIRRIKGSDLAIVDPLQSIMRNTYVFRKLAEQNHIGVQFFGLMRTLQGHGQFADSIVPKKAPQKTSHKAVVEKLIEAGVIQSENDLPFGADLTITLWHAITKPDSKNGEVIVHAGGQPQHWEVKDAHLYNALKTADADAVRLFRASPALTSALTLPTKVLRFAATAGNPVFALRNWMRDQVTAGVNSQTGYVPFWDGVAGAIKVATGHKDYAAWVSAGGKFSGLTGSDRMFQSMMAEILPQEKGALAMARGLMNPRHLKRALMITGEILEEATRVQEFSRARAQGKTAMEAANLSKIVSMNFARAGENSRTLNMVIAFFNAGVQDLDLVFRQHFDPQRRGSVMMKGLLYITLPSLLCWALGKDDEEIQNLPEWRKNTFWNFNIGPLARALGRPGFILSIPKPFLMGQIYGTLVERSLDHATGRDPNGAKKAAQSILESTAFHGDVTDWIPTTVKPLVSLAFNRDTFRDMPIVPDEMANLPKPMQFNLTTSETAKAVGQATGQSPLVIDYLIQGYLAGLGKLGTDATDWVVTKLMSGARAPGPSKDLFEWQPMRSFAGTPYEANAFVTRFYDASGDMDGLMRTWNGQAALMTTDEQARFWKERGAEVLNYSQVVNGETKLTAAGEIRQVQKRLSELNKAMKYVHADKAMSPDEKRGRVIELSRARNETAEAGFRLFPEAVRKRYY